MLRKARRFAGPFLKVEHVTVAMRFGRKVRVEATVRIKHRFLLWWLKQQSAKEASQAALEANQIRSPPIHVREAL